MAYLTENIDEKNQEIVQKLINQCTGQLLSSKGYRVVDFLFTSEFPQLIEKHSREAFMEKIESIKANSKSVSSLAKQLKPRYHFCHSEVYAERIPYRNHKTLKEKPVLPTRFISIAPLLNSTKEKFIYALNIEPVVSLNTESVITVLNHIFVFFFNFLGHQQFYFYTIFFTNYLPFRIFAKITDFLINEI